MITSSHAPRTTIVLGAALAALLSIGLAGCAAPQQSPPTAVPVKPDAVEYHGPVPSFAGPYATEFADAYRSTTSKLDHQILATGKITDQDYAAVGSAFVNCMAAQGYQAKLQPMVDTFSIANTHGGSTAERNGQEKALTVCQTPFEAVAALYFSILQNPQNQDINVLTEECLVKNKIAPASYTVTEFKSDSDSGTFPFDENSAAAHACFTSPLGLDVNQSQQ